MRHLPVYGMHTWVAKRRTECIWGSAIVRFAGGSMLHGQYWQ
jgi:hypothetical protein